MPDQLILVLKGLAVVALFVGIAAVFGFISLFLDWLEEQEQ